MLKSINRHRLWLWITVFALVLVLLGSCQSQRSAEKNIPWKVIGKFGLTMTVYMPADSLKNHRNFVDAAKELSNEGRDFISIYFYDDKLHTPRRFPMTDKQMLHWRARYSSNPTKGFQEFAIYAVVDSTSSPPELTETIIPIPPF